MHRFSTLLLISAALLGCHEPIASSASSPSAADSVSTTRPAATPSAPRGDVITWYTHDGAERLYRQARYDDAIALCTQAIQQFEKAHGKNDPAIAEPLIDLATVHLRQAKFAQAKADIDRADALLDPSQPDQALLIGRLGINKGWRLYSLGETDAALKVFRDARALLEKTLPKGTETRDLAELINNQGIMVEEASAEDEEEDGVARSRRMLLQAWQMRRRLTGDNSPETAESLNNLGMNLLFNPSHGDDPQLALKTLQKSLEVTIIAYGEQNPETAMSRTNVALASILFDKLDEAQKQLDLAMPITLRYFGEDNPDRAYELTCLGRLRQEQNRYDEAEKALTEALAINEKIYGKNHPNLASTLQYLQNLYEAKGDEAKQQAIAHRLEQISGKGI